jgi:hypothetical protein
VSARRALCALAAPLAALALAACGGDDEEGGAEPGSAGEAGTIAADPGAAEASPEAPPSVPQSGGGEELPADDRAAAEGAVRAYVDALNARDAGAVCALFAPGVDVARELPGRRAGPPGEDCASAVGAAIGAKPPRGGPAWRSTRILAVTAVAVGPDRARVTATVRHRFSDRNYVSVEEDVIYLDRAGGEWLLAKPSGSFYRAVGYSEPPLRALAPPGR